MGQSLNIVSLLIILRVSISSSSALLSERYKNFYPQQSADLDVQQGIYLRDQKEIRHDDVNPARSLMQFRNSLDSDESLTVLPWEESDPISQKPQVEISTLITTSSFDGTIADVIVLPWEESDPIFQDKPTEPKAETITTPMDDTISGLTSNQEEPEVLPWEETDPILVGLSIDSSDSATVSSSTIATLKPPNQTPLVLPWEEADPIFQSSQEQNFPSSDSTSDATQQTFPTSPADLLVTTPLSLLIPVTSSLDNPDRPATVSESMNYTPRPSLPLQSSSSSPNLESSTGFQSFPVFTNPTGQNPYPQTIPVLSPMSTFAPTHVDSDQENENTILKLEPIVDPIYPPPDINWPKYASDFMYVYRYK